MAARSPELLLSISGRRDNGGYRRRQKRERESHRCREKVLETALREVQKKNGIVRV